MRLLLHCALAAVLLTAAAPAPAPEPLTLALASLSLPPAALACPRSAACGSVTSLTRRLEGAGFHQRLHVAAEGEWVAGGGEACGRCQLALLQELPRGAYVDSDELAGEARRGGAQPGEGSFCQP